MQNFVCVCVYLFLIHADTTGQNWKKLRTQIKYELIFITLGNAFTYTMTKKSTPKPMVPPRLNEASQDRLHTQPWHPAAACRQNNHGVASTVYSDIRAVPGAARMVNLPPLKCVLWLQIPLDCWTLMSSSTTVLDMSRGDLLSIANKYFLMHPFIVM